MDEIGTPWCVTVDYDSIHDQTVTIRDRDTGAQRRVSKDEVLSIIQDGLRLYPKSATVPRQTVTA
jgi:glycyl-tRNA synthetase